MTEYQNAKRIAIYMAMPTCEIKTEQIVLDCLASQKRVYIPHINKSDQSMDMLALRDVRDFQNLVPDKWGIPSFTKESLELRDNALDISIPINLQEPGAVGLDLILIPAVAFDRDLNRLGHGKGYYDKFLNKYSTTKTRGGKSLQIPFLRKSLSISKYFSEQ